MAWQIFVASRFLTARRKERFISLVSLISILGVMVGVAALIIVISVMSGFDEDLKSKIVGTYSHIEIISEYGINPSRELSDKILKAKHVKAVSFFLNSQALIRKGESVTGVVLKGIIPEQEVMVSRLGEYMTAGSLDLADNNMVVGSELANKLGVKPQDEVLLILPGSMKPEVRLPLVAGPRVEGKVFKIAGIFTSGMYEYDANLVYVNMRRAQEILEIKDLASGSSVKLDDIFNVASVKKELQEMLGFPYVVRTWIDSNKNLLEALKLEKTVMFIILTLIVLVACFNIASALIMTVLEKTKDIGILKAIGSSNSDIMAIFAMQGLSIGFLGTLFGAGLGILLCHLLKTYKFITLPRDIYYIDKLPVKLEIWDIGVIIFSSLTISLLAALYPAYRASRLDPVEAIRYE